MKIRNDFVSNSSSSSFIVISTNGEDKTERIKHQFSDFEPYVFPNDDFKHEFGWEFENTSSFGGKMNFIGIQLLEIKCMELDGDCQKNRYCGKFDEYYELLKKVCKEQFDITIELDESLLKTYDYNGRQYHRIKDYYYIDHQSCVTEGSCMEMFEFEKSLIDFLAFDSSYIEGGNDNE